MPFVVATAARSSSAPSLTFSCFREERRNGFRGIEKALRKSRLAANLGFAADGFVSLAATSISFVALVNVADCAVVDAAAAAAVGRCIVPGGSMKMCRRSECECECSSAADGGFVGAVAFDVRCSTGFVVEDGNGCVGASSMDDDGTEFVA